MTAEEAELTFIRCPSCRSLIPAIASRCRMCGHQFDKTSASAPAGDESQQKSRVRQKTGSTTAQEWEAVKAQPSSWKDLVTSENPVPDEFAERSLYSDAADAVREEQNARAESEIQKEAVALTSRDVEPSETWDESDEGGEEEEDFDTEADHSGSGFSENSEGLRSGRRRRRRRRRKKPNGAMPGLGVEGQEAVEPVAQEDIAPMVSWSEPNFASKPETESRIVSAREEEQTREEVAPLRRSPQPAQAPQAVAPTHSEVSRSVSFVASAQVSSPISHQVSVEEGMLVGWLVNFQNSKNGSSIELRSGRRFVGRGHLRGSDLVFEHESVSTPHGLLSASESEGLVFQDLMSERGTFVLRGGKGAGEWVPVSQNVQLQHGDRIRFGEYELLVVLLPRH